MDSDLAKALAHVMAGARSIGDFGAGGGWYSEYFRTQGLNATPYDAYVARTARQVGHFAAARRRPRV